MNTPTKIAFITWDGPESNYIESLFLPIFTEMSKTYNYEFHIIQFTWASDEVISNRKKMVTNAGQIYIPFSVKISPVAFLSKFVSLFQSKNKIKNYVDDNDIDRVMPRSTMPAILVNTLKFKKAKLVFDADGLPIEERVDFAGLKKSSLLYKIYKAAESNIIKKADKVIVRTEKAIEHFKNQGIDTSKFSIVLNGKNQDLFTPKQTNQCREILNIDPLKKVFVYCGTIGPQYRLDIMFKIFDAYLKVNKDAYFIILTGNPKLVTTYLTPINKNNVEVKRVDNTQIPLYINAADICFGLREYTYSMQGVSPIKLGEYLLCGAPIIASKNIGDTNKILQNVNGVHLIDNNNFNLSEVLHFIEQINKSEVQVALREIGLQNYSLPLAAKSYHKALCYIK